MTNRVSEIATKLDTDTDVWYSFFRKASCPDGAAGDWIDLSMASGTPKYNAYAGDQMSFTPKTGAGNDGIYMGQSSSGKTAYLAKWFIQTTGSNNALCNVWLNDILGYYPLIDLDSTDEQIFDNTQTLPRFTSGDGVRAFLVTTVPTTAAVNCSISYTDSSGVSGLTSNGALQIGSYTGSINSQPLSTYAAGKRYPFFPATTGATGVRSVQSITLAGSAGGFGCLVLAKPVANIFVGDSTVPTEKCFLTTTGRMPSIEDGAYLQMFAQIGGSITAAPWLGCLTIVRN